MGRDSLSGSAGRRSSAEFAIVAYFADGSSAYYFVDATSRDASGQPLARWGRESQAEAFSTRAEAHALASTMQVSSAVRRYEVLALRTDPTRARSAAPRRPSSGSQRAG